MNRRELLDLLSALTDDELGDVIGEARPSVAHVIADALANYTPPAPPTPRSAPLALNDDAGLARAIGARLNHRPIGDQL